MIFSDYETYVKLEDTIAHEFCCSHMECHLHNVLVLIHDVLRLTENEEFSYEYGYAHWTNSSRKYRSVSDMEIFRVSNRMYRALRSLEIITTIRE